MTRTNDTLGRARCDDRWHDRPTDRCPTCGHPSGSTSRFFEGDSFIACTNLDHHSDVLSHDAEVETDPPARPTGADDLAARLENTADWLGAVRHPDRGADVRAAAARIRKLEAVVKTQNDTLNHVVGQRNRLREAGAALAAACRDAFLTENLEHWAGYASDYFKEKWGLDDDLASFRKVDAALDRWEQIRG